MQHAVFVQPGKVEWRETDDPILQGPGEAIVRPIVVGRCDLDVGFLRGVYPLASGTPIGHEIIAEVINVGEAVKRIATGQRVFVPAQISCGVCNKCRRGLTARCEAVPFAASYGMGRAGGFGGGLADLVRVPFADSMLTPVPAAANPVALIGAADMASDAWRAVGPPLQQNPSAKVLVFGGSAPVIGLYSVALAKCLGADVCYIDDDNERAAIAASYGARPSQGSDGETYDVIVVANSSREKLEYAFEAVAPGGIVTSVVPVRDGHPKIDSRSLYHRGVTWSIGRPDCRHAHDGTLSAWANCGFCPDCVPTLRVDWADAPAAWNSDAIYVAAVRGGIG